MRRTDDMGNKKVYTVLFEWLEDNNTTNEIVGTFTNKEDAKECMESVIRTEVELYDWIGRGETEIVRTKDCWSASPKGEWLEKHECVSIVETELKSSYKKEKFSRKLTNGDEIVVYADMQSQAEMMLDNGIYNIVDEQ